MLIEEGAGAAIDPQDDIDTGTDDDGVTTVDDDGDEYEGQSNGDPDPLDAIEDETLRNHMKGLRAKDRREKRNPKQPQTVVEKAKPAETATVADPSNYATKDDLKKLATIDAKKMVAPEVKELWDELTKIPLGGFDPMDAESIAGNMMKRYQLYRTDHPEAPDIAKDFQLSHTNQTSGAGGVKLQAKTDSKSLPGYKEPTPPDQWYPAPKT